jgi:hypothetical protein
LPCSCELARYTSSTITIKGNSAERKKRFKKAPPGPA